MRQLRFSQCLVCRRIYEHEVRGGYGPLYCPECKLKVQRLKARERQRKYAQRRRGR